MRIRNFLTAGLIGAMAVFVLNTTGCANPLSTTTTTTTVASLPWASATVTDLSYLTWEKGYLSSTTTTWYRKAVSSSTYYVHWFDDGGSALSTVADIKVSIYGDDGTLLSGSTDYSPSSAITTSGYSYIYIKVTPYSTSSTGYYYLSINSSSTPPYSTTQTTTQTSYTLTAGAIQVYKASVSSSGTYYIQWTDADSTTSSYADIKVSFWDGNATPSFYADDSNSSTTEHSYYMYSASSYYFIVEGYSTSSSGTFYLDLD